MEMEGTQERRKAQQDLVKALQSMSAYVERCDCMVVLAPSVMHEERVSLSRGRRAFVCYRTWRHRAFCVMEFFASYLSRRQSFPTLLITSRYDAPKWISPVEAQKLACLLYTSPSPRDGLLSRMPSSA